jgi:branched-chain amino acid transport system ATP-binding protein
MNSDSILNIDSISKSFVRNIVNVRGKDEDERLYLLDDIDLLVPKGKVTALIGGNGTGKTTLFNIISGFFKADEGKISFKPNGALIEITNINAYKIARLGIGRMFQDNHTFENMTVIENMLIADDNFFGERPFESIIYYKKSNDVENHRK